MRRLTKGSLLNRGIKGGPNRKSPLTIALKWSIMTLAFNEGTYRSLKIGFGSSAVLKSLGQYDRVFMPGTQATKIRRFFTESLIMAQDERWRRT